MADSSSSFSAHVKRVCGLQVGLRVSADAEDLCRKNYLSFSEMLKPFSTLAAETPLQDPAGHLYSAKDLSVRFSEPRPEPTSSEVTEELLSQTVHWSERGPDSATPSRGIMKPSGPMLSIGDIKVPATTPWFDHYCESYHDNVPIMEHEYFRHYVAAVLVVSSRHSKPIEAFQSLYRIQKGEEKQFPYWLSSHHLYYYHVFLHDVTEGDMKYAKEMFEVIKSNYGSGTCCFLPINSHDPTQKTSRGGGATPEPWSRVLRIPSAPPTEGGVDETDFHFKRFQLKKISRSKSNPSPREQRLTPSSNHAQPETANSSLTPLSTVNDVQEEKVMIMLEDSTNNPTANDKTNNNNNKDQLKSSSSTSVASVDVELGEDPLTLVKEEEEEGEIETGRGISLGECLSLNDQNALRNFVKEFTGKLLSHLTAVLRKLNESLQSKRTMTRRVSNFSRGVWFKMLGGGGGGGGGGGKGGSSNTSSSKSNEESNLSVDSVERLMRLVGDVAFLLQNYELAYDMHHTLKRDLQGKDLWIHYAGALEMAALSAQMLGYTRKETQSYLEEASHIYSKTLSLPLQSLRTSFFLCGVLKERGKYHELAQQLIKIIGEVQDHQLLSALCLEQAAQSFLRVSPHPMARKYAFHLVLAGHHFSRAGQDWHAIRVYMQSLAVYQGKDWTVANDFIHHSCGRLFFSIKSPENACLSLQELLSHESSQSSQQQLSNLKDFVYVKRSLLAQSDSKQFSFSLPYSSKSSEKLVSTLSSLPLPFLLSHLTVTTFDNGIFTPPSSSSPLDSFSRLITDPSHSIPLPSNSVAVGVYPYDPKKWREEMSALEGQYFGDSEGERAVLYMDTVSDNSVTPLCPINEVIRVGVAVKNPLSVSILLRNVTLSWNYTPPTQSNEDQSPDDALYCQVIDTFVLPPNEKKHLFFWVLPVRAGSVSITGLLYNLCVLETQSLVALGDVGGSPGGLENPLFSQGFQGRLNIVCRGLRLNNTKTEKTGEVYGEDNRLCWKIIEPMPRVMLLLDGLNGPLLTGQILTLTLSITNYSSGPVTNIRLLSSLHHVLRKDDSNDIYSTIDGSTQSLFSPVSSSLSSPFSLPLLFPPLPPGETHTAQLLLSTPLSDDLELSYLLILYYEPLLLQPSTQNSLSNQKNSMKCRTLRHGEMINLKPSLSVNVSCTSSQNWNIEKQDLNRLLLTVELSSDSDQEHTFKLNQVSSVSYSWRLEPLQEQREGIMISPGQTRVVYLHASRDISESETHQLLYSDASLSDKMINSSVYPCNVLISSTDSYKDVVSSFTSTLKRKDPTGGGGGLSENKMCLTVFWETVPSSLVQGGIKFGQQSVTAVLPQTTAVLTQPHPQTTPTLISPSPYDLVRHALQCPSCVSHDFSVKPLCIVQVDLTLENCTTSQVNVMIETLRTAEVAIGVRSLESHFQWLGQSKINTSMDSLSHKTITLYATFSSPGTYCLNSLRVKACLSGSSSAGSGLLHQRWQLASYIVVDGVGGVV